VSNPRSRWGSRIRFTPLNPHFIHARNLRSGIRQAVDGYSSQLCVDIGCGEQPYRSLVETERYIGLDLPVSGRERALKRPDVWYGGLILPLRDACADLVLCTEVIEHVPDPQLVVSEAARVLAPGGVLVLSAPQTWGLHEAPYDFFRYTEYGLRLLCERASLVVQAIWPLGGVWEMVTQRLVANLFYRLGGRSLARKGLLALAVNVPVLAVGMLLDRLYGRRGDTLGHVCVAAKPSATGEKG